MGSINIIISDYDQEIDCLRQLKELVKESRELDNFSSILNDRFLLHFVRGKKYNAKAAFSTLKNYIEVRKDKYPEIFKNLNPSSKADAITSCTGFFKLLKNQDAQGRMVVIGFVEKWDIQKLTFDELIPTMALLADEFLYYEDLVKNGLVQVFDLKSFGWRHGRILSPFNVQKSMDLFLNALPVKFKGYHLVHEMSLFNMLFKAMKPLLPKKLHSRIHFHSNDFTSLHKHLSPDILPKSLGGNLTDEEAFVDGTDFIQRIFAKEEYYQQFSEKL